MHEELGDSMLSTLASKLADDFWAVILGCDEAARKALKTAAKHKKKKKKKKHKDRRGKAKHKLGRKLQSRHREICNAGPFVLASAAAPQGQAAGPDQPQYARLLGRPICIGKSQPSRRRLICTSSNTPSLWAELQQPLTLELHHFFYM